MRKNIPNRQAFISFQPCTFNLAKKKEKDICHLPLNAMQYPIQKLKLFSDKHCILENHPLNQNENKQCWSVHTHTHKYLITRSCSSKKKGIWKLVPMKAARNQEELKELEDQGQSQVFLALHDPKIQAFSNLDNFCCGCGPCAGVL